MGSGGSLAHPLYTVALAIRRAVRALSLSDPKAWNSSLWNLYGAQAISGETVTEQTALTLASVWNAVELIAGTIAALPLHLLQTNERTKRVAVNRKLFRIMHAQWNEYMTAKRGRETQLAHMLLWGNGYAEIQRNGYGDVIALWPIAPHRVTPRVVDDAVVYEIRVDRGKTITLPRRNVLHLLGPSDDGLIGYSRIALARKSIGLGMALETFGARYFGAGTHPGVIVSHPHTLSATAHDNLKKSLTESYSGLGNTHRLLLLEEGMKLEKLGIPPEDSQFLESRQFSVTEIARWFNLPPHKLKDLTRSSFNNIESEQRSFYTDTLLPSLVDLEQSYDLQLLTESDRDYSGRGRLYFKHNVEGILRGDTASRSAFYGAMLDRGVFSINEVRALEDLDPVPGGDVHLVPLNMTTLEHAGEPPEPTPPPAAEDPYEEEGDEEEEAPTNGNRRRVEVYL